MHDETVQSYKPWLILGGIAFACFAFLLIRGAWLDEDAFISYRSADHFLNGFGLRWNVHERVQAFTHPLWLMLITAASAITGEFFIAPHMVCILCSLAAVAIVLFRLPATPAAALLGGIFLCCSQAFVDYSSSGLENPLTHLLIALFAWRWFSSDETRSALPLALLACLAMLNRMDTILFFAPALGVILLRRRNVATVIQMIIGFLPFVAWEIFSVIYYGFPFPNTAYAKLNTGIARPLLIEEGIGHFYSLATRDPFTLVVLVCGLIAPGVNRDWRGALLAAGAALYLAYFVYVGGDYMMGRFFSAPVLVAVLLVARSRFSLPVALPAVGAAIAISMIAPLPIWTTGPDTGDGRYRALGTKPRDRYDVSDQEGIFNWCTALVNGPKNEWRVQSPWAKQGIAIRESGVEVKAGGTMGFRPFFSGPEVIFLDKHALVNTLMARLPMPPNTHWRSGHFPRPFPDGYIDSARTGENRIKDPDLAKFYDKLVLITRGPIFSADRWVAIWGMNTGQFDDWLAAYIEREYGPKKNKKKKAPRAKKQQGRGQ